MQMKKRLLAILLALTLALSLLPAAALADEDLPAPPATGDGETQTPGEGTGDGGQTGGDAEDGGQTGGGSENGGQTGGDSEDGSQTGGGSEDGSQTGGGSGNGNQTGGGSGNDNDEKPSEPPAAPTALALTTPKVSASQGTANNIFVSWAEVGSSPAVDGLSNSNALSRITVSVKVGSASAVSKEVSVESSNVSFDDITLAAADAGKSSVTVSVTVTFEPKTALNLNGKDYKIERSTTGSATCTFTPIASADPASAVENPGKPLNLSYNYSTGALSWSISPTYENNVTPGASTKINQFANEHFILTLKSGSTIVEQNIHFDTTIASTTSSEIKVTRSQNSFSASYKPSKTLDPGTYTIELLNERSMGSGGNLTGTCSFTVSDTTKPTTVKAALEKLLNDGFSSSSKAADVRAAILDPVSGTTTASKLKNLVTSLQAGTSTALDLVDLVRDVEQKFLKAVGITVNRKSDSGLGTSISAVTGLGLNTASGSQITLSAASASKSYDTPSGARACQFFSLTVSGLSNNTAMDFPVQVSMKLPDSFNSTDNVYVLHYTSASSPEKLDAYLSGSSVVFTTTSFSDFALVQENASSYTVTVSSTDNGSVSADKKEAASGSTVTLTVRPDAGYALALMLITDKNNKSVAAAKQSDTQYTFTMPASDVTVQAAFTSAQTPSFTDVPASHTFYKEISWIAQKGLMNGTGNSQFSPSGNVNRQQLWMVLGRMAGANPANMAEARTWAINNDISDGTNPVNTVSRQQLVTMLYRYAVKQNITLSGAADLSAYSDSGTVSDYAKDAMAWAVGNGIVSGTSDGRLNPQGSATRAHFAAFLYRFGQKTGM